MEKIEESKGKRMVAIGHCIKKLWAVEYHYEL